MARTGALFFLYLFYLNSVAAEILTPPYFNLALGKKITATATCGDEGPELYCKLVGANADHDEHVIQGQVCDICDAFNPAKKHPPEYAVDDTETWWQSPPLSRGMKYNEVNLTIDLGQEFHVAYVFVRMGNSPRPGLWALEKSTDYGKTFKPWQYFSDSPQDCERYFGKESLQPITKDDSVICSTEYSKIVPLEGGEIPISLLNSRPSSYNYFNSSVLQEWTRATNVRLRLMRTKNLLGHLMSVARQDPTVTRRYFYSIKDISIGGRCMCNGHADTCDPAGPERNTSILVCRCQHNTCGDQCAQCCPGFEQKKWRISQSWDRFECEPCNCHNHASECKYDPEIDKQGLSIDIRGKYEGGGVCQNCQHNTEGINCNKCKPTFYRPQGRQWDEIDVCRPCNCNLHNLTGNCEEETGKCECRPEYTSPNCDSCAYGYYDYPYCKPCVCNLNGTDGPICTPDETGTLCPCKYNYAGKFCEVCKDGYYSPECKDCECNSVGSVSHVCDKETGNCTCKSKYSGRTCNQCEAGYYNYPTCSHCNCDTSGTQESICDDITGQCICKIGFGGARCDQCISGYYMEVRGRERQCVPCNCSSTGSTSTSCAIDGKCNCLHNYGGRQCDQCSPGFYKYPVCLECKCKEGAMGSTCDDNGRCHCKPNFDGEKCDKCREFYYNYPNCEDCSCDPRGVIASFAGCGNVPDGQLCQCKERVTGRKCNDCKDLFWNLQDYNPYGCEECNCNPAGTLGGLGKCNTQTGHCNCKHHVGERQCDTCQDGFYRLNSNNLFGCTECDCDIGGSIDNVCDKISGQCRCHSRVEGRRCDRPIRAHYFPTLHQFQYEVEEGLTPWGPVRYRSDEDKFPNHSWKGYVIFTPLQNEVINSVHITKSSIYRIVLKYANPLKNPVIADVIIKPDYVGDITQRYNVLLKPTSQPEFVTVAGEKGTTPSPFVMNPGNWNVTIKTTKEVMIDYFVLIPEAYYEATVLTKVVDNPCVVGEQKLCRQFAYPNLNKMPSASAKDLATSVNLYVDNEPQLNELDATASEIPLLNDDQNTLQYNMHIEPNGNYILFIEYVTPINQTSNEALDPNSIISDFSSKGTVTVKFKSGDGVETAKLADLNDCPYTSSCRQVVIDDLYASAFNVTDPNNVVTLEGEHNTLAGIISIIAVPEKKWHLDYITPRPYCLKRNGKCAPAIFAAAVDSKKVEIESGTGGDRETRPPILDNSTSVVYLGPESIPITVESKVPNPDEYVFIVHYYQPDDPESTLPITLNIDGVQQNAAIKVEHCPSNSGCRALITSVTRLGNTQFPVNENVTITFVNNNTTTGLWLDYVLMVAAPDFTDSVLKEQNILDYTREFIGQCANNNYHINLNETGFCRDAAFSITAEFNSGTLGCFCDVQGSTEFECDTFGGQCRCKPNVIGRTCNSCKNGYYGFPDCKPCRCPETARCDNNGQCICPTNVIGDNCDQCKKYTFNYDVYRGCDNCDCHPQGVNRSLECDILTGQCDCKNNVIDRRCNKCKPGHYAFPECYKCYCNENGTTDDICDQSTAQCYCKKQVTGPDCNTCKEGYFNLQAENPDGCTKCYCFGKSARCKSAFYLYWRQLSEMRDWYLVQIDTNETINIFPESLSLNMLNDSVIGAELGGDSSEKEKVVYFGAPSFYLGKRLDSYGGFINYSILYTAQKNGHAVAAPDVIIGGANSFVVHNSIEQPTKLINWAHGVRITEGEFTHLDGSPVSREQFMNILVNVTSIYIRATYWHKAVTTRLVAVTLDIGVPSDRIEDESQQALTIEECTCPQGYEGASCEQCARGYYRLSTGTNAGFCVPCQCNGHAEECDVHTGVCLYCDHFTMGDHCEMCIEGYHGNATVGSPFDCLICACPLPVASNNFAISCEIDNKIDGDYIKCQCKKGYYGASCSQCATGYYGDPNTIGDYCKPCNCSGNINLEDEGSCDTTNGACLKCVNNTFGAACNLCAPGFFGDAVFSKNCTACDCDEYGMDHCDATTGTCVCRPGVIGDRCDSCAPDHWGLSSGQGCTPCDCGIASNSSQCDDNGQCKCAKGVTGKRCEQCAAGYWNYTEHGCEHCNCNNQYSLGFICNSTGQCECIPGAIGEKCDRCPERWVLIPQSHCQSCDSCTDALIFTIDDLRTLLANETQEFKNKADSFFTTQRLNYILNQTHQLRPRIGELSEVDVDEITNSVSRLEGSAKTLLRSAEFGATDSENQIARAASLATDADKILQAARERSQKAKEMVKHVADLATGLEQDTQLKQESVLEEARQTKSDIEAKDLAPKHEQAIMAFNNATALQERMSLFVLPVNKKAKEYEALRNATKQLQRKLEDMLEYTVTAKQTAENAGNLNAKNRLSKFGSKVMSVTKLNSDATQDLIDTGRNITNATQQTEGSRIVLGNSANALQDIADTNKELDERLNDWTIVLPELTNLTNIAKHHANSLKDRADSLTALANSQNNNSRTNEAYAAASAYSSIVKEIGDAKRFADVAEANVKNATDINNILKERVNPSFERSSNLLNEAYKSQKTAELELTPNLTKADLALANAWSILKAADEENKAIQMTLKPDQVDLSLNEEIDKSLAVNSKIAETNDIMSQVGKDLAASKTWAQTLPKLANEAQKMTTNVDSYLANINDINPNISSTFDIVKNDQDNLESRRVEANKKLQQLRDLIEQARTVANRIQVGVTFDRLSTLQPRLPDSVEEMSTSTHVSAYFRTREKDGFLLYLGNPKGTMLRRTRSDDFMVIGVQNGYPYLVIDIGDGETGREPARIGSDKFVSDNRWYQVIVDRVGRNVKLSIRESLDNGSEAVYPKEAVLPGHSTIFNLDQEKSKLYVGGVPSNIVNQLQGINFPAFEGQIEELMIGDTPVGLWNFIDSTNLKGGRQRDKLISSQSGPQEYRFNGRGHATMPGRAYLTKQKNHILLFFRTYAPDGLLHVVGEGYKFFSVEMQQGRVYLQVSLGNDPNQLLIIGTDNIYNDGKWHKLDAARYQLSGSLKVDNEIHKGKLDSGDPEIPFIDNMNFGGTNKNISKIKAIGFDGCIRQISMNGVNLDLSESEESIGMSFGCQFGSLVSLSGDGSFLKYTDITAEYPSITLKFKTSEPDGLLFVYFSRTQTASRPDSMSLSLVKGQLKLLSQNDSVDSGTNTYNDSQWHVVTITHSPSKLKFHVDDFEYFQADSAPAPLHILNGILFVGGLPPNYVVGGRLGSKEPFKGCLADTTINGMVLNLLEPSTHKSVTFGRCGKQTSGVAPELVSWAVPTPSDILPLPPLVSEGEPPQPPQPAATPVPVLTTQAPPSSFQQNVNRPTQAPVTTSDEETTTRRPRPPPEKGCALSYDPYYVTSSPEEGYRFGTRNDSRIEYGKLPGRQDNYDLTITFRTFDHAGLIFYASAEKAPSQFLALYMKEGKLHFSFNCGGETALVTSDAMYNDTEWHKAQIVRNGGHGKLSVDSIRIGDRSVTCDAPALLTAPFFYGGLRNITQETSQNLMDFYEPFKGCLKGLKMNDQYVQDIRFRVNALQCTDKIEEGVYFGPSRDGTHSNYLKLSENFKVGAEIAITMEIKPRNASGLLLSVHGRKDYLILELLENELVAHVENGRGPFHARFNLDNKFSLCDGNWHAVHVVKIRHVVSVGVDGSFSDSGMGQSPSTDTHSPLYIGGHEKLLHRVRGVESKRGFTGCIRNIRIKETKLDIPLSAAHRNTHVGACPID